MPEDKRVDVAVIGSGPGGYVAAIRAAQLGLSSLVIEKEFIGGTCLNIGCIPSKALLEATHRLSAIKEASQFGIEVSDVSVDYPRMQAKKQKVVTMLTRGVAGLLRKGGIDFLEGAGRFMDPGVIEVDLAAGGTQVVQAANVIIATGSVPMEIPGIPFDGETVVSSREALEFNEIPNQLVVVGAGYIGLELGSVYSRLGSSVTVLEMMDKVLPEMDEDLGVAAHEIFARQGMEFHLGARVSEVEIEEKKATVRYELAGSESYITADKVLVAAGRQPFVDRLGLETIGLKLDQRGFIPVDAGMRTAVDGVYAIGDVVPTAMLAHVAMDEGMVAAQCIAGQRSEMNYTAIPAVVFTHPEIASVGLKEQEAIDNGYTVRTGQFPFRGIGRARARGDVEGWVKMITDAETEKLIGVHCIGAEAGHLIHEAVVAMAFGGDAEDIALTVHAHPTLSEAMKEAALAVDGRSLHI
tara:strand:- start:136 stop:1536 length:1401 start_codon:yes stop_codon:yes gene_type:complete